MKTLSPLIPREVLFGNPIKASPQLSPDGSRMAYLAPDEGVLNVWVGNSDGSDARAVTRDRKRGIRMYLWAFDGEHLLYVQDLEGDENWHIWSVHLSNGTIRDLTPFQGVQAHLTAVDHRFPSTILAGLNVRDDTVHDVYRIDLRTGAVELEVENPGDVVGWVADAEYQVRGAHAAMPDGGFQLRIRDDVQDEWRPLVTWGPEEEGSPHGFAPGGKELYISSSIGADAQELRTISLATGEEKTLAQNDSVDVDDIIAHPTRDHVQAVGFARHRLEWTILDPDIAGDFERLSKVCAGEVRISSRTLDDRRWLVVFTTDTAPAQYYRYDRDTGSAEFLFTTRPELQDHTLAPMRSVDITSRDGLTLPCYLSLPAGTEAKNLPLVLNVHGGPWARDHWGCNAEAQWLANRGYACLQVNFRGSTGFGKRFLNAGNREWAGKMHDDLLDAVNWAVDQGIADRDKVAIYGGSYGGYAALVGAAFTPDVFRCAVDIVGPSSLITLINSIPPYWAPLKKMFTVRVGDPENEPEFLEGISPLFRAADIKCPMLIAQGANDPRVKQAESEQIVQALRSAGKEVEYLLYADEGHGFARPENRLNFYAAAEAFLAKHLGGRAEG